MLQIGKILFPTDFSPCSQQALDHALFLAQRHEAELHMLHAVVLLDADPHHPEHHFPDPAEVDRRLRRMTDGRDLEKVALRQVQLRGISAPAVILDYAEEEDVDLIVAGTHGRRGLRHMLLGSVAEELVRLASCPVLTVREADQPKLPSGVDRILAPIDFSEHSKRALGYALEMARSYDAHLDLLHVVELPIYPAFYYPGQTPGVPWDPAEILARTRRELEDLWRTTAAGSDRKAQMHVLEGRPATDITAFAEERGSDLIVLATQGLTGLPRLLLGSVAERVVRLASCPVLTVSPHGKSLLPT